MPSIEEMAESLGRALGGTPEYRTMQRAAEVINDDRELTRLSQKAQRLEESLAAAVQKGDEPPEKKLAEYDAVVGQLQASSLYQSVVAAQTNFEKVMAKVDAAIRDGLAKGAASRIIIP